MKLFRFLLRLVLALVRFLRDVIFGVAVLIFIAGLCVLGYQVYIGLKHGEWLALPLQMFFTYLVPYTAWIDSPESWYGLHKLLTGVFAFTPLSLFLIVAGLMLAVVMELLEASWPEYRALWRFLNTPLVLLLVGIVAAGTFVYYWDNHQATRGLYRESNRYTLESLYRINTLLETLSPQAEIPKTQWQRARATLTGQDHSTPLFSELTGLSMDALVYYLTAKFPQEQAQLRGIQNTLTQLDTFLTSPEATSSLFRVYNTEQKLTDEQLQALRSLHERLQRHVPTLEALQRN